MANIEGLPPTIQKKVKDMVPNLGTIFRWDRVPAEIRPSLRYHITSYTSSPVPTGFYDDGKMVDMRGFPEDDWKQIETLGHVTGPRFEWDSVSRPNRPLIRRIIYNNMAPKLPKGFYKDPHTDRLMINIHGGQDDSRHQIEEAIGSSGYVFEWDNIEMSERWKIRRLVYDHTAPYLPKGFYKDPHTDDKWLNIHGFSTTCQDDIRKLMKKTNGMVFEWDAVEPNVSAIRRMVNICMAPHLPKGFYKDQVFGGIMLNIHSFPEKVLNKILPHLGGNKGPVVEITDKGYYLRPIVDDYMASELPPGFYKDPNFGELKLNIYHFPADVQNAIRRKGDVTTTVIDCHQLRDYSAVRKIVNNHMAPFLPKGFYTDSATKIEMFNMEGLPVTVQAQIKQIIGSNDTVVEWGDVYTTKRQNIREILDKLPNPASTSSAPTTGIPTFPFGKST